MHLFSLRDRVRRAIFGLSFVAMCSALAVPCLAQVVRQLTDGKWSTMGGTGAMDDAGTFIYVNSSTDVLGNNPDHLYQIFRFDTASGAGEKITSFPKGVSDLPDTVSVSDDGQWISFVSRSNLTGQNHDESPELFVMKFDGSLITQVTNDPAVNAGSVTAVVLSGSANRFAFRSTSNPLGTNPFASTEVFVVDFNGSNLKQLTTTSTFTTNFSWAGLSISDDGQRIVFAAKLDLTGGNADRGFEVFAVNADGTNLRQFTSGNGVVSRYPSISGDGTKIAFDSNGDFVGGNSNGTTEIYVADWSGTGLAQLTHSSLSPGGTSSFRPSLTDDGLSVVFASDQKNGTGNSDTNWEIFKVNTDGTALTQLTNTAHPLQLSDPVVAGGSGRIAYLGFDFIPDSGDASELRVMTAAGSSDHQLLVTEESESELPEITRDGAWIVLSSTMNPFGTNADGGAEIFRMHPDGSGLSQVTNFADEEDEAYGASISADGATILFSSIANPFGQNPDGKFEVFLIHADGTGLVQLTSGVGESYEPRISANGTKIVFTSTSNLTGGNADLGDEVFCVNPNGTGLRQLTTGPNTAATYYPHVDDSGTWVVFLSSANLGGMNPNGQPQIFRIRTDGTGRQRISTDTTVFAAYPDISAAGDRIVYISTADPAGTNADHNFEVFLYDTTTSLTRQLTSSTAPGISYGPAISGDGNWVYFDATARYAENDPDVPHGIYRVSAAGGAVQRIGGPSPTEVAYPYAPRPDMTGGRAVYYSLSNSTERNPDRSPEVFLVDLHEAPQIRVGQGTPTMVSWDNEAGPIRYDVLRGDVANLAPGAGSTINLGAVDCLEDNSPDADITGNEDFAQPPPGHAFFFLYRGSNGLNYGPGSWGQGSSGSERVPGSGACAP